MAETRATYPLPVAIADLRELVTLPERLGAALSPADLVQALDLARGLSGCARAGLRLLGRTKVEGELALPDDELEAPRTVPLPGGGQTLLLPLRVALSTEGTGLSRRFGLLGVGPLQGEPPADPGPIAAQVATLLVERALARRGGVDRLTGLLSRPAFERGLPALTERIARGEKVALALLDIDGLREQNARGGVAAGDELLSALGAAVAAAASGPELACRWGSDELLLVLPGRDQASARALLKGLAGALAAQASPGAPAPSFSAGLALAPDHARDAAALLFQADQALAGAKREGPGRIAVWDESLRGSRGRDLVGSVLTGSSARDYRHVQALLEALQAVSHLRPLPEALGALLDRALDVTGAERGLVLLKAEAGWDVAAARARGGSPLAPEALGFSASVVEAALAEGRAVHRVAEGPTEISPSAEAMGLQAVLCAPIGGEDVPAGAVYLDTRDPARFDPPTLLLFDALVAATATALRNAVLHDRVRARAEKLAAEASGREAELVRVRRQLERGRGPTGGPGSPERYQELVGSSAQMRELFALLRSLEGTSVPVVIEGESGTGKELVARAIHAKSPRADGPLVAVNCGAIPENLVESELFGHVRGAFTGALTERPGLLEAAHGGTLFLDELGELPLESQAKLLRVLESGELRRVGESKTRSVDVRVVAATNRDLRRAIAEGVFREDLFYRLAVFRVRLAPLRERPQDVPLLVGHLLAALGRPDAQLTPEALRALVSRRWQGNVRELRNVLERALALAGRSPIQPEHLPDESGPGNAGGDTSSDGDLYAVPLQDARALFSLRYARRAIEVAGGSVPEAARKSGVSRQTLYRVIAEGERLLSGEASAPAPETE